MRKGVLVFLSFIGVLLFTGCESNKYVTQSYKVHDDGRRKAITCITPLYDPQNIRLPWSFSEDLTKAIKTKIAKQGNVYLTNLHVEEIDMESDVDQQIEPKPLKENLSLNFDLKNLKSEYPDSEFVVFMELTKHNVHKKHQKKSFFDKITPSCVLDLAVRVRIVDLRSNDPKVILHEIVEQSHLIPKQFSEMDKETLLWGKKTYSISPLGFAHGAFAKELVQRIEGYLTLAKTL